MDNRLGAPEALRWDNYRLANSLRPEARERELGHLFKLLNPQPGELVWESGTGNGYLTVPLARAVAEGRVLTTDVTPGNIAHMQALAERHQLPVETLLLAEGEPLDREGEFDAIASIATFHHYDNRAQGTGERGRRAALRDFFKALRPGGRVVVADVLHDTRTQRYFDAIDNPRLCAPHGHPHDFFTLEALRGAAADSGFRDITITVEYVPWQFASIKDAESFVHTIHNAQVPPGESLALAEQMLGFEDKGTHHELGWELFYLTACKP